MKTNMPGGEIHSKRQRPSMRPRLTVCLVTSLMTLLVGTPVHAAFHLWNIREIYTDASGTYQFIELFSSSSSQTFVGGPATHRDISGRRGVAYVHDPEQLGK